MNLQPSIRLGSSGGGFSPATLFAASEPGAWYDPSDLTTLFQDTAGTVPVTAAGQTVARINDKSGRGNHATQATAGSRPTYQIDSTGRPFLLFDGTDDSFITPTITPGTDKVQVFAGVRKLSDAATGIIAEFSASLGVNNGGFQLAGPLTGGTANYAFQSKGTVATVGSYTNAAVAAPVTSVITGLGDISGDRTTLRSNGVDVGQSTVDQGTGNYLAYPMYIGRRGGSSLPFNGRLYSLIVRFGANLTAGQIGQIEAWVNGKTGAY